MKLTKINATSDLIRYEWDPKTEVSAKTYNRRGVELRVVEHAPLKVDPLNYWQNLRRSMELRGEV